jgi:transcriptional regulator with XRE-family HTH domain
MCDLYKTIETYCQKNNIKIADLARNTGLNKTLFSDLKNGRSKTLSIDRLIIIADYFNISLDELVGRKRKTPDDKSSEVIDKIMKLLSAMTPEQKAAFVQTAEALILPNSKE